jgi:hypothetical protein
MRISITNFLYWDYWDYLFGIIVLCKLEEFITYLTPTRVRCDQERTSFVFFSAGEE